MYCEVLKNGGILLANSNHLYFNKLVKTPCHKTPYRCPHRLSLSSQSSRSCAGLKIKVLKDKGLEFANSIGPIVEALRQYDGLVLFHIHPMMLAKYRQAFTPSRAKDDPTDAELQRALLLRHRDKLKPLAPQSAEMRALGQLVDHRRRVVADRMRITHRLTNI